MTDTSSDSMSRPSQHHSYTPPSDISSAPSSAPLRSPMTSGSSHPPYPGSTSRPSSGVGAPQGHPYSLPPPTSPRAATLHQSQYYGIQNPQGVQLSGYQDLAHPHGPFIGGHDGAINQMPAGPQSQKRAYRQRRKDPSCDACRERKVKCDATDTSPCTECTSRSVRCQFTKDTNRRMTSLKHNQDLIKELARTKSELEQAKIEAEGSKPAPTSLNGSSSRLPDSDSGRTPGDRLSNLPGPDDSRLLQDPEVQLQEPFPSRDQPPAKRRRTIGPYDFSTIGRNMQRYGHGIFKAPRSHQPAPIAALRSLDLPELPQKEVADSLLDKYYLTVHSALPVVHWHDFQEQYDRVYQEGSLQNTSNIWVGLLFALLALGALHQEQKEIDQSHEVSEPEIWREGKKYFEVSRSHISVWMDSFSLDHARAALLNSMFLVEINMKSAGWVCLGIATRIAFDIGLHCEAGTGSAIEEEMRRRVWWCIYSYDCLLSLEMGRPSMIKEQDCNVGMPRPTDDRYIRSGSSWTAPPPEQSTSQLPAMIQAISGISRLHQVLKIPDLSSKVISAYESHFTKLIDDVDAPKETQLHDVPNYARLAIYMHLQNARMILHRNNLAPLSDTDTRSRAIDNCALVARETAKFLQRYMEDPRAESQGQGVVQSETWQRHLVSVASAFLCTHFWRCMLFLCFRLDFQNALVCARASAALQDARPINAACGHYLEFYLKELIARFNQGLSFDTNEEMIAYASGDLQGNLERSWVWHMDRADKQGPDGWDSDVSSTEAESPVGVAAQGGQWQKWDWVLLTLGRLQREKEQQSSSTIYGRPGTVRRISPPDAERLKTMVQSPEGQAAREKMRIKDLI